MALVTTDFNINITPGAMPPVVHVSEYDIGRSYTVELIGENNDAFTIPTGTTATIEGTLNGVVGFSAPATISNNKVVFALTESMTAYAGKAWCKIKLTLNDEPIQTCAFIIAVDRAGVESETVIGAPGFEEQIKDAVDDRLSALSEENVKSAELDEDNMVSFKNANGIVLFTLDLSELGTPASYGNLVLSAESLTVEEGGTGAFTVSLDSAPSANQIVYLAVSDNTRLTVSPVTLTFTPENYAEPQTVTVSSAQDDDNADDSIIVTLTSKNVDGKQLVVTVSDNYYVPQLVTDGLVLHFDYSGTDRSSDIITDLAGGVTASGWSTTIPGANGVIGATKPITVDTSTEAWANFVAEMKGSTEGFTIEQFASSFGKTFNFTGANNVADKAMVSNLMTYPGSVFNILTPAIYYKNQSKESVYASYSVDGVIRLSDGSTINPNANADLLKKLPNWNNYAHTVIRFYPDGTCKRTINGCQYATDGVISDFASFDFDAMFSKFYILPSCDEIEKRWHKTQRIYNRILTEDEIKNNETVEASKLVLSTF